MYSAARSFIALAAVMPVAADTSTVGDDDSLVALEVLETITVENEHRNGYDRDLYGGWLDEDGDRCNTRAEVLLRDSIEEPDIFDGCEFTGTWRSAYDDEVTSDPRDLQVDHVVSLKEAWDSGAWAWDDARRAAFANDLDDDRTLRAVNASANQSKGDRDPSNWIPPHEPFVCEYLGDWVAIKARWDLSMDESEHGRIRNLLTDRCPDHRIAPWPEAPPVLPAERTALAVAVTACIDTSDELVEDDFDVLDAGHSVVMIGERSFDAYRCLSSELGLPEWTYHLMVSVPFLDGLATVDVAGYTVTWANDPDDGAVVVVHDDQGS